jgi:hypothetical protein
MSNWIAPEGLTAQARSACAIVEDRRRGARSCSVVCNMDFGPDTAAVAGNITKLDPHKSRKQP